MSIERKRSTRNSAFDWISITRVTRIIGWYSSLLPVPKRRFISAKGSRRRRRLRFKTCTLSFLISRKLALILWAVASTFRRCFTLPESLGRGVTGPDPKHGSYGSFATFKDPDGNGWLLQEITMRLPGRE